MARFAFDGGMRSDQRKKIIVIADLGPGGGPALRHVALGAIRTELAQVNVSVAIVTILADVGEDGVRVALRAWQSRVAAAKGKLRLPIVVETKAIANGSPAGG